MHSESLAATLQEEGALAHDDLYGDEIVEVLVGMVGREFGEGAQRVYPYHRHHALQ